MQILIGILMIFINLIVYLSLGSLVLVRKGKTWSLTLTVVVGFFMYYGLFAICVLPIMLTYRPLSLLSLVWGIAIVILVLAGVIVSLKSWKDKLLEVINLIKNDKKIYIVMGVLVLAQVILVVTTYNFTLDAAYYVANVATSVDTNMINVYDPFTGAWQDHFELRYVFATYSINDAVICQIMKLPALIETKMVMSSIVMILTNMLYLWIARFLCGKNAGKELVMFIAMIFVNLTFITLYTSSNFLMTRTYEGKAIVGNIAVIAVFAMYMIAVREGMDNRKFFMLFMICFGTATVSSTANMLIPAEVCVLFVPYVFIHKEFKSCWKYMICLLPEIVMMLMYVLYVKGYFAIYTYPR